MNTFINIMTQLFVVTFPLGDRQTFESLNNKIVSMQNKFNDALDLINTIYKLIKTGA